MLTPQQQLSDVAKQVKQWQQTKAHRNSALPEKLRQQILPLFEYFTNSELQQALKLSESLLYKWAKLAKNTVNKSIAVTHPQEFVALPTSKAKPENNVSNSLSLELTVGEQCKVRLTGDISLQQLDVFTRNIFMYQAGVNS